MTAIEMQMTSATMNQNMVAALGSTNQVMASMSADMDVAQIRDTLKEFNKQMGKQEMNNEMITDAFDMAEGMGVADDAEDVYAGILGEIGMEGAGQVGNNVGSGAIASQ
jgi:hypothetical protein